MQSGDALQHWDAVCRRAEAECWSPSVTPPGKEALGCPESVVRILPKEENSMVHSSHLSSASQGLVMLTLTSLLKHPQLCHQWH